jgi:hypothetical protein
LNDTTLSYKDKTHGTASYPYTRELFRHISGDMYEAVVFTANDVKYRVISGGGNAMDIGLYSESNIFISIRLFKVDEGYGNYENEAALLAAVKGTWSIYGDGTASQIRINDNGSATLLLPSSGVFTIGIIATMRDVRLDRFAYWVKDGVPAITFSESGQLVSLLVMKDKVDGNFITADYFEYVSAGGMEFSFTNTAYRSGISYTGLSGNWSYTDTASGTRSSLQISASGGIIFNGAAITDEILYADRLNSAGADGIILTADGDAFTEVVAALLTLQQDGSTLSIPIIKKTLSFRYDGRIYTVSNYAVTGLLVEAGGASLNYIYG